MIADRYAEAKHLWNWSWPWNWNSDPLKNKSFRPVLTRNPIFVQKTKSMGSSQEHRSDSAPEPVGLYPHARQVGNLLFLSGVGPRSKDSEGIPGVELDENGNVISRDIEAQCRSVFENVRRILEDSGSSWDRIVDVTVFLTHMKEDFETYNRIYAEYFAENRPARTTIEISSLPTPIAIELKVIATVDP